MSEPLTPDPLSPDPLTPSPQSVASPFSPAPAAEYPPHLLPGAPLAGYGVVPPRQEEYDAVPPLSQGERVLDTFFSPSKTFADIRRNRSWWLPFLLLSIFGMIFGVTAVKRVGIDTLTDNAMKSNPAQAERMQNASPEQRAQGMKIAAMFTQYALYSAPLFLLLFAAILALLLWVGCNFILGGSSTWPGMFAVSMYAMLPGLITYLLILVTLFVADPDTFNLNNPVGTNIGYYLPQTAPVFLKSLLTSFDVVFVWEMFLLGLGGAIVARLKPSKGIALVLGAWFVIVLIKAGLAAI